MEEAEEAEPSGEPEVYDDVDEDDWAARGGSRIPGLCMAVVAIGKEQTTHKTGSELFQAVTDRVPNLIHITVPGVLHTCPDSSVPSYAVPRPYVPDPKE